MVAPSCSLLHVPHSLKLETALDPALRRRLAFAEREAGRGRRAGPRPRRGREGDRAGAGRERRRAGRGARRCAARRPRGRRAARGRDAGDGTPRQPLSGARRGAARAAEPAALAGHHHRLLPADRGGAGAARQARARRARPGRLRGGDGAPDRRGGALAGRDRRGRARPWRVRAQRHGEVLRRAARGLRLHQAWLGAELRQPLRRAADHLGRRLPPGADDGALVGLRAVPDPAPDEGDAHRSGDHAAMVLRAHRHPARDGLPPDRARDPRRGRRPRGGRHPDHPDRRAGLPRGPAAARRRSAPTTCAGRSAASGSPRARCATRPRSTPTCATASSTTSSTRSRRWTPT